MVHLSSLFDTLSAKTKITKADECVIVIGAISIKLLNMTDMQKYGCRNFLTPSKHHSYVSAKNTCNICNLAYNYKVAFDSQNENY